jgi:hypothetical protein
MEQMSRKVSSDHTAAQYSLCRECRVQSERIPSRTRCCFAKLGMCRESCCRERTGTKERTEQGMQIWAGGGVFVRLCYDMLCYAMAQTPRRT